MARYEYDDFWVEFSPRQGGGYDVAARAPDGTTAQGSFQLPFTDEQLEQAVRTIGYTRAAAARPIAQVTTERRLSAEQLGGQLAEALLEGPAGDLYANARSTAVAKDRGVRLWLSLGDAPGLSSVPWEFLYLQPTFLASQRRTPIVRFLRTEAPVAPRRIEGAVRILGVVASPDGFTKLDVTEERKRVDEALEKARQGRGVTIDWLEPATPRALRLALQKGDYHILHFVGHSAYVGDSATTDGGGVIFLENEDHSAAQISDSQLVNLLGDQELRLVVLNSCEGARASLRDPFAGIATSIVALGIPAVVAMQFEISDKAAITFAEELYQSLIAREEPIDVAVAEARKAVFTEVNETEWATPVLFLRNVDGRLFDFAPPLPLPSTERTGRSLRERVRMASTPMMIGVIALGIAAFLLGGFVLAGGLGPGPSPSSSPAAVASASFTPSPSPTGSSATGTPSAAPSSSTRVASPTPTGSIVLVPGTSEWAGPRTKSNLLAVAAGRTTSVTNLGTVLAGPEAEERAAGVATSKANVFDTDPAWDPNRSVLGFTRHAGNGSDVLYVVPGVGRRPDNQVDKGIMVKDPIDDHPPTGTFDHAPLWLDDGNLMFARTHQCAPGPGCVEDVVQSQLTRIGDYVEATSERPRTISARWSDIRNLSAEPFGSGRFLVAGRNLAASNEAPGVWIVDSDGSRTMLPGSENAASAVFTAKGTILALVGGSEAGWGSVLAEWSSIDAPSPRYIDAFFVLGSSAGVGDVPSAAEAEFSSISPAPLGDARYGVLVSNRGVVRSGTGPPTLIGLLDSQFVMTEVFKPRPPSGQTWNQLVALGW